MRATLVMVLVCVAACSRMASDEAGAVELASYEAAPAAPSAASAAGSEQPPAAAVPAERMVIRQARLGLRVADPRTLLAAASRVASAAGGFVLGSQVQAVDGASYRAELTLRVPEAELDRTLSALHALGTVLEERVEGEDVTEEFVDVSARLHAQRTLEGRLLALLERSAELKDLLAAEQELARVRTEIERVEGRKRYLQERARMASIQVLAQAPAQPLASASQSLGSRLSNALRRSTDLSLSVVEGAILFAGFVVPAAIGVLSFVMPLWWLRRRRAAV